MNTADNLVDLFEKLLCEHDLTDDEKKSAEKHIKHINKYFDLPGHKTNPSYFTRAKKRGETAFQRAIYLESKTVLNIGKNMISVYWADMETPIGFSPETGRHARRLPVDLVGLKERSTTDKNIERSVKLDTPFLCELKYKGADKSKYDPESPLSAVIQLCVYYCIAKRNKNELDKISVHRIGGRYFKWKKLNTLLILAANKDYWQMFERRYGELNDLIETLNHELRVDIRLFSVCDLEKDWPYPLSKPHEAWKEIRLK